MKKHFSLNFKFKNILVSILLLILIFILIFFFYKVNPVSNRYFNQNVNPQDKEVYKISYDEKNIHNNDWFISIPKIDLYNVRIEEGTDENTLNQYIGHFMNTAKQGGNIGLAAHNRGYVVNYFSNLKNIEYYDYIFYYYNNKLTKYKVILKKEIDSYDWSYLQNTNDNRITLITCIENMPNKRLCVQALEVEEE